MQKNKLNEFIKDIRNKNNLVKEGEIIQISLNEYLNRKLFINRNNYHLIQKEVDFDRKTLSDVPYKLGYLLKNKTNIPFNYICNNREIRLQVLAGLIDRCGYYKNNCYKLKIENKQLAKDVEYLVRSLGFISYLKINKNCYKEEYKINILGNDLSIIPTKLKKIDSKYKSDNKDYLSFKFEIEKLEDDQYYGFTLDKDHLYLTDDFIVHHNCGGNGKSKLIELFEYAFGEYCGKMSVTLITQKELLLMHALLN